MTAPTKRSYEIIIAGVPHPIDWPVLNFLDEGGFNAHAPAGPPTHPAASLRDAGTTQRFRKRRVERTVAAARAYLRQLVVHLDGCPSVQTTFKVLQEERGLSCHFLLDENGTIYQTLDLADCAFHAATLNETSIGIEMCNRGDAQPDPTYYRKIRGAIQRDTLPCTVNDHTYLAFDFTVPQYAAMAALGKALARHLPGIRLDYPQSSPGTQAWNTLTPGGGALASYAGYLGHYHITTRKWDPGPFDFKRHLGKLTGRRSFPIGLHGKEPALPEAPPLAAAGERAEYLKLFGAYYVNNELEGTGGMFPTGPLDRHRLYHGGIHLHAPRGTPVVAPVAGKVVLARNGPTQIGIGSTSFVLLAHNLKVGSQSLAFYTLLFHLEEEKVPGERPRWMAGAGWRAAEPNGVTVPRPAEMVQAGEVVGHVGVAGPDGDPQVHWEIFTLDHAAVAKLDTGGVWKVYSGATDSRFVERNAELIARLGDADLEWTHGAATYHLSEWSDRPDWAEEVVAVAGKGAGPRRRRELEAMVAEQIVPALWWRDDVGELVRLGPADTRVYTYHPVTFLRWLNDLVGMRPPPTVAAVISKGKGAMLDIDDVESTEAVDKADTEEPKSPIQLRDILDGYGD